MRAALPALLALVCVLAVAADAAGRVTRAPVLTFREVTLDGKRQVLSRHTIQPVGYVVGYSLSPDHKKFAYIPQPCEGCPGYPPVIVASVRSPYERVLVDTGCPSAGVSWAPNGRVLALDTEAGADCRRSGLWFVNPDGNGFRNMDATSTPLVWSPDSRFLAGNCPMTVFSRQTHSLIVVDPRVGMCSDPSWSPNGKRLVFGLVATGNQECPWVLHFARVRSNDGSPGDDCPSGIPGTDPSWSPDGRRIAYIRLPARALWVMSSRGDKLRRLDSGLGPSIGLLWSPDGRQIAYAKGSRLFVRRLGARRGRLLASGHGGELTPLAWSRDGKRILYFTRDR
jgi:Tol biopolymer transport system component